MWQLPEVRQRPAEGVPETASSGHRPRPGRPGTAPMTDRDTRSCLLLPERHCRGSFGNNFKVLLSPLSPTLNHPTYKCRDATRTVHSPNEVTWSKLKRKSYCAIRSLSWVRFVVSSTHLHHNSLFYSPSHIGINTLVSAAAGTLSFIFHWAKIFHSTYGLPCYLLLVCYFGSWFGTSGIIMRKHRLWFAFHQQLLKALEKEEIVLWDLTNNECRVLNSCIVLSALRDASCNSFWFLQPPVKHVNLLTL